MFTNVSATGVGLVGIIVYVIILIGKLVGIEIAETELTGHVQNIVGAIGFAVALWGQYRRKDLVVGIKRK